MSINDTQFYRFKYLNNKLNQETIEVIKDISQLLKHYRVKFIFMEDLNKLNINDSGIGTCFNRLLTRNLWKRTSFDKNLEKRAKDLNSKLFKINLAYSSFIGSIQYNFSDPINASLEVARRGYNVIHHNKEK